MKAEILNSLNTKLFHQLLWVFMSHKTDDYQFMQMNVKWSIWLGRTTNQQVFSVKKKSEIFLKFFNKIQKKSNITHFFRSTKNFNFHFLR